MQPPPSMDLRRSGIHSCLVTSSQQSVVSGDPCRCPGLVLGPEPQVSTFISSATVSYPALPGLEGSGEGKERSILPPCPPCQVCHGLCSLPELKRRAQMEVGVGKVTGEGLA